MNQCHRTCSQTQQHHGGCGSEARDYLHSQSWKVSRQGAEAPGNIPSHALHSSKEDDTKCHITPCLGTLLWDRLSPGWHGTARGVSGCTAVPEGSQGIPGENCCKGRLERKTWGSPDTDSCTEITRGKRHPKLQITQINNLVINSSPQANSGGCRGPTTSEGWAASSAASVAPPAQEAALPQPLLLAWNPALVGLLLPSS